MRSRAVMPASGAASCASFSARNLRLSGMNQYRATAMGMTRKATMNSIRQLPAPCTASAEITPSDSRNPPTTRPISGLPISSTASSPPMNQPRG